MLKSTADGSETLFSERYKETFHSTNGAVTESQYVFLQASGVADRLLAGRPTRVLEIGFGLGLNALISADAALSASTALEFHSLENDPSVFKQAQTLRYDSFLQCPELADNLRNGLELVCERLKAKSEASDEWSAGFKAESSTGASEMGDFTSEPVNPTSPPTPGPASDSTSAPNSGSTSDSGSASDFTSSSNSGTHTHHRYRSTIDLDCKTCSGSSANPETHVVNLQCNISLHIHHCDAVQWCKAAVRGKVQPFDAVYLDAFSPDTNPECWTDEFFSAIRPLMAPHAKLSTYSAKGVVRRSLLSSGFEVSKLPGPPGKREMMVASLKSSG